VSRSYRLGRRDSTARSGNRISPVTILWITRSVGGYRISEKWNNANFFSSGGLALDLKGSRMVPEWSTNHEFPRTNEKPT
jgi:hypothetical protein